MCYPAVYAGMMVASAAMQQMQAKTTAAAQVSAAEAAQNADLNTLDQQAVQIKDKATAEALATRRAAMKEYGTLRAAQDSAGFKGATPFKEGFAAMSRATEAMANTSLNQSNLLLNNAGERDKVRATAAGRINEANSRVANPLLAGLQILGAGAQGYGTGQQYKLAMKGTG